MLSRFQYAISVLPAAEVGGLSVMFDFRLHEYSVCDESTIHSHFIVGPVMHVMQNCRDRVSFFLHRRVTSLCLATVMFT
jgi:hypothetical protein